MSILITGATGNIGRHLVAELLGREIAVNALSRDPAAAAATLPGAVTVYGGSLASAPTDAFAGVEAVFLFPADDGVHSFVEHAIDAGVSRFVVLSSLAVSEKNQRDAGSASQVHHRAVEDAVTSRTDDVTIVRPGTLANNLLSWSYAIRSGFPVRVPYPTSSQAPIHEADVASVAALALTEPGQSGLIHELTGPESLTKIAQLAAVSAAIGREVTLVDVTPDEFRADVAQYMPGDIIDMLLDYWSDTVDAPEVPIGLPFGLPGTPLSQWAQDHRAAFAA